MSCPPVVKVPISMIAKYVRSDPMQAELLEKMQDMFLSGMKSPPK